MSDTNNNPKALAMPDAFVILFFVVVIAWGLTYLVPAGSFDLTVTGAGQSQIDASSYKESPNQSTGLPLFATNGEMGLVNYAFEGLTSGSRMGSAIGVVMFILLIGGSFGIIMASGAVNNGMLAMINRFQHLDLVILPAMFLMFSFAGAVFGMGEEAIAFCIILYPLVRALGYDGITTVMITYVATQIGFACSWMNPFSVAVAQGLAGVPVLSGAYFRMAMWAVFTIWGIVFTVRYAQKIKKQPSLSLSYDIDKKATEEQQTTGKAQFNGLDKLILVLFAIGLVWVIWGVIEKAYYIPEIASQFFAISLVIGIVCVVAKRMTANQVSQAFQHGASALLPAALIVGMAKGILLLLGGDDPTQASVLNTLLHWMGESISGLSTTMSAVLMLVLQSVFNFFVASGSGQAALTMPLMAPLADLVDVSRQVAVLAFQLGDGLTNLIIPTSASLIGCLGVVKLDWVTWLKFIWKFQITLFVLAVSSMIIAVQLGYH